MNQIRTYKMTFDLGFAPNGDGGVLSLATCKTSIRQHAQKGEWIAGFTSGELNGDKVGEERLVFLMQVEEILSYEDFWDAYPQKRPDKSLQGDNIYTTEEKATEAGYTIYRQIPGQKYVQVNPVHNHGSEGEMKDDLKSDRVLISTRYRYFGKEHPLSIPDAYRINTPSRSARYGHISEGEPADRFIDYVFAQEATEAGESNDRGTCGESCHARH